jgi:hypothetical protein
MNICLDLLWIARCVVASGLFFAAPMPHQVVADNAQAVRQLRR